MPKKKISSLTPMTAPQMPKPDDTDHEAEGAMNDMIRVEKHKSNPDLMKRVHAIAGRHAKALKSIRSVKDLKDLYDDKYGYQTLKSDSDTDD